MRNLLVCCLCCLCRCLSFYGKLSYKPYAPFVVCPLFYYGESLLYLICVKKLLRLCCGNLYVSFAVKRMVLPAVLAAFTTFVFETADDIFFFAADAALPATFPIRLCFFK